MVDIKSHRKVLMIDDITKRIEVEVVESIGGFRRESKKFEALPVTHHIDEPTYNYPWLYLKIQTGGGFIKT